MPSGWWRGAVAGTSWSVARLHPTGTLVRGVTITPRRLLAAVLCCVGFIGLLTIPGVAQATTDYDTDNDGLIAVDSLEKLNAIRWDLDGDGVADKPTEHIDPDDDTTPTQGDAYAAAFPSPATGMGCLLDHDGDPSTDKIVRCIGYELTERLDFSGSTWASGRGWKPIGVSDSTTRFTATFDGNDNTISNLYINRTETSDLWNGLFGLVGAGAELRNVRLLKVNVTGHQITGGLVGNNDGGAITNSQVSGTVSGQDNIGGLVGGNEGTIRTSYATGTVSSDYSNAGGLVGKNSADGTISTSHAMGAVAGEFAVGGLVGINDGGTIRASYATGDVARRSLPEQTVMSSGRVCCFGGLVGRNKGRIDVSYARGAVAAHQFVLDVGGLVGINEGGTIRASYARGDVAGVALNYLAGGLIGRSLGSAAVIASYATGKVTGASGGLLGFDQGSATFTASYWDTETSGVTTSAGGTGKTTSELQAPTDYTDSDPDTEDIYARLELEPG